MGYKKRNERCIPKEGMPHAHKACQKKREERCIPKEGMPHTHKMCQKKERKRKYSPYQKNIKREKNSYKGVSSIIHQKYPHTCTS